MKIIRTENSIHARSRSFSYFVIILFVLLTLFLLQKWYLAQKQENEKSIVDQKIENNKESPGVDFLFTINDQPAGLWVAVGDIIAPEDFWLTIYEMNETKYGNILGAARVRTGTATTTVELLRPIIAGSAYAGVVHQDDGDIEFDYTRDVPLERDGSWVTRQFKVL